MATKDITTGQPVDGPARSAQHAPRGTPQPRSGRDSESSHADVWRGTGLPMAKRTCHCLQHALTTYLLDAGADLAFVTGNRVPFTLADLVHLLQEQHYPADLEQLKQSLD